jgi:hypothetical protein
MPKLELEIDSSLPPQRIVDALTDFSERRPDIWPGLSRDLYEVYSVGETSAEIREGTKAPGMTVWAREHYDWSEPNVVRWTVKESNFSKPGGGLVARIEERPGGSRIHLTWEREGSTLKGRFVLRLMWLLRGKPIVSSMRKALDKLEREPA